jgi:6-phosphogluconolactonase
MKPELSIHDDLESAARAASALLLDRARAALEARGELSLALSGGSTPRALYARMRTWTLPWHQAQLCFGDERCVPPDHAESNARMVQEALITPAGIPQERVHRMRGELPPEGAAADYEHTLRGLFGQGLAVPRFDIVLLGLGADGHTASLFPRSPALSEQRAWVVSNAVPSLAHVRLTLTYPVLNAARLVLFLVSGPDKAAAAREVLTGEQSPELIPARGVQPSSGELHFFLDRAAAKELPPR